MKTAGKIIFILLFLAGVILGTRYIIQQYGPGDWQKRIQSRQLTAEKRIEALQKNLNNVLDLSRQHISSLNSLIKIYKELAKVSINRIKNLRVITDTINQTGNEYLKARYITEAIKYYELALEINPGETETLTNLGVARYNLGLYEMEAQKAYAEFLKAELYYKKAIQISENRNEPTDKQWVKKAYLYLALMYRTIKEKKIDEALPADAQEPRRDFLKLAIEAAENLFRKDPEYAQGLFMLGALHYMKGEMEKSRRYYMLIIASNQSTLTQKNKAKSFINRLDSEIRSPGITR